ncbi:9299_t:CDS:2 [Acaulospora colombiana]|uniref:9299_t:CDS:1 n=1 Tax=Acaulospora colombiana TaxID=27376 RepID=A0ACA9JUU1_9GLOM|nr:9299_t:CDS:2 [Acaulospora colombiana]
MTMYTYTWNIKDFQDLFKRLKETDDHFSERFYSPVSSSPSFSDNLASSSNDLEQQYIWRFSVRPRGGKNSKEHMSAFLWSYQSDFERERGLTSRKIRYSVDIYRSTPTNSSTSIPTLVKLKTKRGVETNTFNFFTHESAWGSSEFCAFSEIFPNNERNQKVDLVVKVNFFDLAQTTAIPNDSINDDITVCKRYTPSLDKYFDNETYSDVEFSFDCGSKLKASRVVLASRSAYFESMFEGSWKESKLFTIPIESVKYECFKLLIRFIYTGRLANGLDFDILLNLYVEAEIRGIEELRDLVSSQIIRHHQISSENWEQYLILGWKTSNKKLKEVGLKYACDNWDAVKSTVGMQRVLSSGVTEWVEELMAAKFFGYN